MPNEDTFSNRTKVFYGDLVRAVEYLHARDDVTRQAIAELLGFGWASLEPTPILPPSGEISSVGTGSIQDKDRVDDRKREETLQAKPQLDSEWITSTMEELNSPDETVRLQLGLPADFLAKPEAQPVLMPLLNPRWARGVLSGALATLSEDGPVDVARLVQTLAKAMPLRHIPRSPRPTLSRGVQLLVDTSHGMLPYEGDKPWLIKQVQDVVGEDRVQVLYFAGCPSRGVRVEASLKQSRLEFLTPGTVMLLLTDLGIGRPLFSDDSAGVKEWCDFATAVKAAGCHLVVFVPYAESRWPPRLKRLMYIVQWDRKTTAGMVKHIVGSGHKVE